MLIRGVQALLSSGAIFPLYIYPGDDCSAWSTLFNSIPANPNLPFTLIINPESGPGSDSVPDTTYQACITQALSLGSNVNTVGYVLTGYGERAPADVLEDINTYMNWPVAYRPSGIFLDETAATAEYLNQYTSYANQVRADDSSGSIVILDPGINVADPGFFSIADFIVTAEAFYDDFSFPDSLVINATEPAAKQIVILHDAPSTLPTALIDDLTSAGIASTFITSMPQASAYNTTPPYWESFCAELTSSQS
ncbi:Spherulation-specific family 4 [Lentinula boryana]|uniref:Spherulation-specific family 4 n=1 Tax=Lentinula boryana TaxID=40481 RepID=A0ABQ8QAQ9_9AGAR|nr:Spherulation-specific family 4 [Lentinula boryana]